MAQATDNPDTLQQVLTELRELKQDVEGYNQEVEQFNQKFGNYQKATQWIVSRRA